MELLTQLRRAATPALVVGALALVGAACTDNAAEEGSSSTSPPSTQPAETPPADELPPAAADLATATLDEVGGSGVQGQVVLTQSGAELDVVGSAMGDSDGAVVVLRSGDCAGDGGERIEAGTVEAAASAALVEASIGDIKSVSLERDGVLACGPVDVHVAGAGDGVVKLGEDGDTIELGGDGEIVELGDSEDGAVVELGS